MSIPPSKRALVTGGAGFLGSHMCEALLARGWEVTCLDNFSTGSRENIRHLPSLRVVEGNANRISTWRGLKDERFEVVVHYAATVGVQRTLEHPMAVLEDVRGMQSLTAFARAGGAGKIIFASSSEVYGHDASVPMYEGSSPVAWSPYTTVKLYGEYIFSALEQETGIPATSLRFFNVYGPRQAGNAYGFVVAKFVQQVLAGESPTVFGDGTQTRDFVYVDDNIAATLAAIESDEVGGQIMNVGTGVETRVVDLAEAVIRVCGMAAELTPIFLLGRIVEVCSRCAAVERMEELLGVRCSTPLEEGLSRVAAWYRAQTVEAGDKVALNHIGNAVRSYDVAQQTRGKIV